MISYEEAMALLLQQSPEPHLINHARATAVIMRSLAKRLGKDENLWAITGLLHDLDFPLTRNFPWDHGRVASSMLQDKLPPEALDAILAHNEEMTKVSARTDLDFALRCAESVTGLISAAALMRPTKIAGMEASSIKKKMKDKAFAAAVDRSRIREYEKLGLDQNDFFQMAIVAMTEIAVELGLT